MIHTRLLRTCVCVLFTDCFTDFHLIFTCTFHCDPIVSPIVLLYRVCVYILTDTWYNMAKLLHTIFHHKKKQNIFWLTILNFSFEFVCCVCAFVSYISRVFFPTFCKFFLFRYFFVCFGNRWFEARTLLLMRRNVYKMCYVRVPWKI